MYRRGLQESCYIQLYRIVNNRCVAVSDNDNYTGTVYRTNNNGTCSNQYNGTRYLQYRSYASELLGTTSTKITDFKFLNPNPNYYYYNM